MAILIKGAHMPPEGFCKDLLVYSTGRVEQYDARANLVHTYRDAASEVPDAQPDDTISRQAAITIPIPPTWDRKYQYLTMNLDDAYDLGWEDCQKCIEALPSAQPEIIMCKNCIWFDRYTDGIEKHQWDGFCASWARNTCENWYCSRAERRTDEKTKL